MNSALRKFVINHWLKPVAWLVFGHFQGRCEELLFVMGALVLLLTVSQLTCAVYFVDVNSPKASDANPGTDELPFKTINRAAQLVQPGDVVVVKAGIYREHVRLTRSGKPGAPITFIADPPGSVILTGSDPITGWERVDGNAPIYRVPWKHRFVINRRPDGSLVEHHPDDERHKLWGRAELVIVDEKLCLPALTLDELRLAWRRHVEAVKSCLLYTSPSPRDS